VTTIRATIEAEIEAITTKASAEVSALRAKLQADEPTLIALLDTEVEKVEGWFHTLAAHFTQKPPSA
jgi:hypothetical protein